LGCQDNLVDAVIATTSICRLVVRGNRRESFHLPPAQGLSSDSVFCLGDPDVSITGESQLLPRGRPRRVRVVREEEMCAAFKKIIPYGGLAGSVPLRQTSNMELPTMTPCRVSGGTIPPFHQRARA